MSTNWGDIAEPPKPTAIATAAQVMHGPLIPPQQQLLLYSPDQWEEFVQEWLHYRLKKTYKQVQRFTGAGDMGIDVAGFADEKRLEGVWDNCWLMETISSSDICTNRPRSLPNLLAARVRTRASWSSCLRLVRLDAPLQVRRVSTEKWTCHTGQSARPSRAQEA